MAERPWQGHPPFFQLDGWTHLQRSDQNPQLSHILLMPLSALSAWQHRLPGILDLCPAPSQTQTHAEACACTGRDAYKHRHTHSTHEQPHAHSHTREQLQAHTQTCTQTPPNTCRAHSTQTMHTCVHIHEHTCTCMHPRRSQIQFKRGTERTISLTPNGPCIWGLARFGPRQMWKAAAPLPALSTLGHLATENLSGWLQE